MSRRQPASGNRSRAPHIVGVLAMHGLIPYDLAIACEVFGRLRDEGGKPLYEVRVCGEAPEVRAAAFGLKVRRGLRGLDAAHTIVVPGIEDIAAAVPSAVRLALQRAGRRGARIASICSGAFVMADAGLLDGHRATTHWLCAEALARRHPAVIVDANVLFVDQGRIVTSAGASAGMDMCLHLVRRDFGNASARLASRLAVAPLDRAGGQSQYIRHQPPRSSHALGPHLEWIIAHLRQALTLRAMAAQARMSERTYNRQFQHQLGTTPMQWLHRARIGRAQELLEGSAAQIDQVAYACGFQSPVTFRASFRRVTGLNPSTYRSRFNGGGGRG